MKINRKEKGYLPPLFVFSFVLALLSYLLLLICKQSFALSDFLNRYALQYIRLALAHLTSYIPFSLFELLFLLLLPTATILIVVLVKFVRSKKGRIRSLLSVISMICLVLTSHIYTLGIAYHTTPLANKLSLDADGKISADSLYDTTVLVRDRVNELSLKLTYSEGESRMPYSFKALSEHISAAYDVLERDYPIFDNFSSYAKPVRHSSIMSDMGISGVYGFITGEANINMEYPDYNLPFVVAHEFAHQRGFARENEANFIAYLVCISSADPYVRYSGYLNMYEYLASALYRTDKELYATALSDLSLNARADIIASNAITAAHSDSLLNKLMDRVNDTYLKANGTEGVISYSYVVRLTVAYHNSID